MSMFYLPAMASGVLMSLLKNSSAEGFFNQCETRVVIHTIWFVVLFLVDFLPVLLNRASGYVPAGMTMAA